MATGCATKPYIHETISAPEMVKKQFAIDDGACLAQSYSAAAPTQYVDNTRRAGNGFASGFNNAGGNDIENAIIRKKIYSGCMLSKGWSKAE